MLLEEGTIIRYRAQLFVFSKHLDIPTDIYLPKLPNKTAFFKMMNNQCFLSTSMFQKQKPCTINFPLIPSSAKVSIFKVRDRISFP